MWFHRGLERPGGYNAVSKHQNRDQAHICLSPIAHCNHNAILKSIRIFQCPETLYRNNIIFWELQLKLETLWILLKISQMFTINLGYGWAYVFATTSDPGLVQPGLTNQNSQRLSFYFNQTTCTVSLPQESSSILMKFLFPIFLWAMVH